MLSLVGRLAGRDSASGLTRCCDGIRRLPPRPGTTLTHASLPGYALRITEPNLCDPTVKQYSGYIDVLEGDKHFFFWCVLAARWRGAAASPAPAE